MVTGRTKGVTFRGMGNVVLVAAQREDGDGNPTEEYIFLRADEFGRLRTVSSGTFLALLDTPAAYAGEALNTVRVNAAEDALEFAAAAVGGAADFRQVKALGAERWSTPGWLSEVQQDRTPPAGEMFYLPILVPQTRTYTRIGIVVTGGGGGGTVARLGIYNATLDADGLTPSTLVLDAGTVATDAVANLEIVISQSLVAGAWYFLCYVCDGTPTVRGFQGSNSVSGPLSGQAKDLVSGVSGDLRFACLTVAGQGIGALGSPAVAPTDIEEIEDVGMIRLRDA